MLVRWLYSDRIRDKEKKLPVAQVLYEAWMLADKLAIPELQNAVIPLIVEKEKELFTVAIEVGPAVYNGTQPGSLLRKFHVDQIAVALTMKTMAECLKNRPDRFPVELLRDLCLALRANGQGFTWLSDFNRYMVPVPDEDEKTT